jgi:hypothetical protein
MDIEYMMIYSFLARLLRAILAGIAASILVFRVLGVFGVGLRWLGITMLLRESMPDRLQETFVFGCLIGATGSRGGATSVIKLVQESIFTMHCSSYLSLLKFIVRFAVLSFISSARTSKMVR